MSEQVFEVKCGFGKWSICIDLENAAVIVKANRWPNIVELKLHDIVGDDLKNLTKLFWDANAHYETLRELNKIGKGD